MKRNGGRGYTKGQVDDSVNASSASAPASLLFQDSDTSEDEDNNMDAASRKFKFHYPFSQPIKCPRGMDMAKEYAHRVKEQEKAKVTTRKSLSKEEKSWTRKLPLNSKDQPLGSHKGNCPCRGRAQNTYLHLKMTFTK